MKMIASLRARLANDDMLVHGAMMMGFGLLANGFDYIYQFSMSRMLSAEEYATFSSLYSIYVVVFVFSGTVGITMNYFWQSWLKRMLIAGVVLSALAALLSPLISAFLHIGNVGYAITLFGSLV